MNPITEGALVGLQCFVVLFVALHNWIPLGRLNDVKGARAAFPGSKLLITTLINFTPVSIGLAASVFYFGRAYPGWLFWLLWITYGLAEGVVDTLPFSSGPGARCPLSSDVRNDARIPARAQWHKAEHAAYKL